MDEDDDGAITGHRQGYGQYCPIARAVDVLGERWSMLILRDLLVGTTRFNDLSRGLPGLSRSLLAKRLRQFERAAILDRVESGEYRLTQMGLDLEPIVFGLGAWGAKWTFGEPVPEELDAEVLVWWMHSRLDTSHLPGPRNVLHVRFTDDPRQFWIVIEHGEPSVCLAEPGFDVDVSITSDLSTLYQVWLGKVGVHEAERAGRLRFDGPRSAVRSMPSVLRLSPIAGIVSSVTQGNSPTI